MSEQVFNSLVALYPNDKEQSLNRAVSAFLIMRNLSLKSIKGKFDRNELIGIVAAFNGTIIGFDLGIPPKAMLLAQMEDAIALENNDSFYSYTKESLLQKINQTSEMEAMFFLEEISRFWNEPSAYGHVIENFVIKF